MGRSGVALASACHARALAGSVSTTRLTDWLIDRGLLESGTVLEEADLRRALDAREGLRTLLLANNGAAPDTQAVKR
jgi:hypothetical protein